MIASYNDTLPLVAFGLAIVVHLLMIRLSFRKGLFLDRQQKVQKAHRGSRPRIGGAGIFIATLFLLKAGSLGFYLLLSALPVLFAGIMEDYSGNIRPLIRLAIMAVGAVLFLILMPQSMFTGRNSSFLPTALVLVIVFFLLLASTNGINFMDGQNGLAAGSALLSVLSVLWLSFRFDDRLLRYLSLIVIAALMAFLLFNFPKGRLFLGDGGAYLLGFLTAALGIFLVARHQTQVRPLLLPVLLIYPLWEVSFSICRKFFWEHLSPLKADKRHLHQLIYRSYGDGKEGRPAIILLPFQALVCIFGVLVCNRTYVLLLLGLAFCIGYVWVYIYLRRMPAA